MDPAEKFHKFNSNINLIHFFQRKSRTLNEDLMH